MHLNLVSMISKKYKLKPILLAIGMFLFSSTMVFASISTVYIAQSSSGAGGGTSCTNALPASWFNSSANWGSSSNQIGPGTTVHLCGTFTGAVNSTMLTVQKSGTSGNLITLLFEAGTVFTSSAWSTNGAIDLNGQSFITVDGGSNGIIQNTANGTALANHNDSNGITGGGNSSCGSNVEVRNLVVQNIYVRTGGSSDPNGDATGGFDFEACGSNLRIHDNTSTQAHANIFARPSGAQSGWAIYNNKTVGATWGICINTGGTSDSLSNSSIYNNDVSDGTPWEDPADNYHKDGIFIYGQGSGGGGGSLSGLEIYNNYVHGTWGPNDATAFMYINQNVDHFDIFNNIFSVAAGGSTNGLLTIGYGANNFRVLNNTFVGYSSSAGGVAFGETGGASSVTFENNIVENMQGAIFTENTTYAALDYNDYFNISGQGTSGAYCDSTGCTDSFTTWQAKHDSHGIYADPKLDALFRLLSGSAAIGHGLDLTNLNITALDFDKAGNPRPSTGAWDTSAFNSGQASVGLPAPPQNLVVANVQ